MASLLPVILLCLLLSFPAVSVRGASAGLVLWFHVVLPTLAPFLICTRLVAEYGGIPLLMRPFAPFLRRVFRLSEDGAYVLLCGLLCGYPLGAKLCADFLAEGRITSEEARYLLSVCNHPSPMFVSGYLRQVLPAPVPAWYLFFCLYGPVLPLSILSGRFYGIRRRKEENQRGGRKSSQKAVPLPSILLSVSETMVLIGNYLMLFSILSEWFTKLPGISSRARALLSGLCEITTGTRCLAIAFPAQAVLLPVLACTAFGGLSGLFQTFAVIRPAGDKSGNENAGLLARHYVLWKLLHAAFTAALFLLTGNAL